MQVEQGILLPTTLKPVGKGISGAQHATVHIAGLSQRCIVKKVGYREIAAECFCALLGNALALPTLIPVIVTDPADQSLWFGARNSGYPDLATNIGFVSKKPNRAQLRMLTNILSKWPHIGQAVSFDELIANGDRNPGNILWNGLVFTLIDHEQAVGNAPKILNKLALFATQSLSAQELSNLQNGAIAAALTHGSQLNSASTIWVEIQAEFATLPSSIANYYLPFETLVKAQLVSLVSSVSNAVLPLLNKTTS